MPAADARRAGFSLIEAVVALSIMAILAGAAAPFALQQVRASRITLTQERMRAVAEAMVGRPSDGTYGYVGDMGALPASLADLNQRGLQPGHVVDGNDGIGAGYNGPYVANPTPSALSDAWGTAFSYTVGTAQVTSAGADRVLGNADDMTYPVIAGVTTGTLVVNVTGVPNDGGVECLLGEDEADVFASFSNGGVRDEVQLPGPVGVGGPFVGANLHSGLHGLRVTGQGVWAGASARDVVELWRGSRQRRITLVQSVGPGPGCGP